MRPPPPPGRRSAAGSAPSVDDLADVVARGGEELLSIEDPLEAEAWAESGTRKMNEVELRREFSPHRLRKTDPPHARPESSIPMAPRRDTRLPRKAA